MGSSVGAGVENFGVKGTFSPALRSTSRCTSVQSKGNSGATVLDDLPESILVEEILLRLPSKDVLRCRAVRKSWCHVTSTNDFMLAHHRRQPSLPLINIFPENPECGCTQCRYIEEGAVNDSFVAFRVGVRKLWPVLRTCPTTNWPKVEAACDGFLVVSNTKAGEDAFYVCNPSTRQCAPLPQLPQSCYDTSIVGFYRHHPSGEYRVLYCNETRSNHVWRLHYYILTVGSNEPRCIYEGNFWCKSSGSVYQALLGGMPSSYHAPVLHRGKLHWEVGWYHNAITDIIVFDTVAETFRWMQRPASLGLQAWLLEMDGALALSSTVDGVLIDFSVVQDYAAAVWAFKFRINLSAVMAPLLLDSSPLQTESTSERNYRRVAVVNDHELLIQLPGRLLHCDVDGRFLGSVECQDAEYLGITSSFTGCIRNDGIWLTSHLLQESIFPLPSFDLREEDGVSKPHPFILAS